MNRRKFLSTSAIALYSLPAINLLSGCGGSGGGTALSPIDQRVALLQAAKTQNDSTVAEIENLLGGLTGTHASPLRTTAQPTPVDISSFFAATTPTLPADSPLNALFFQSDETESMWRKYETYGSLAHQQFGHQYVKLLATMRLFDYQNRLQETTQSAPDVAAASAHYRTATETPSEFSDFDNLLAKLKEAAGDALQYIFDAIRIAMNGFFNYLKSLFDNEDARALLYATLTYFAVDKLLKIIADKTAADLSFESSSDTLLSFAKMAIAAVALMGLFSLEKLAAAGTAAVSPVSAGTMTPDETLQMETFLGSVSVQSALVALLFKVVGGAVGAVIGTTKSHSEALLASLQDGYDPTTEHYTLSAEQQASLDTLKKRSVSLAVISVVVRQLFTMLSAQAVTAEGVVQEGFAEGSDAETFLTLFGAGALPQTDAFTTYTREVQGMLKSGTVYSTESASYFDQLRDLLDGGASWRDLFDLIATMSVTFSTQASDFASQTETDAFAFASHLADLAYSFTAQTASDAYDFATHMADLAYSFTMDIEEDAYQFAMKGMEFGYLFASRGEEVGVMADRILWMAVQIGQMADRIGEMADRIVYTEQLIVYTEMLILDFGLLIYDGMKTITNLMLTGMALILDREWYTPAAEDQIVTVVAGTMEQMMANMQEYALAVLDNQSLLREITLRALEWVATHTAQASDTNTTV
ncbi:hypothetical protein LOH54_04545 [Sulfurimonas sp. HSL-3221]|uniref:hypothetical protein n=1 Tax=Sulfurimonadaceae TaxID=2771471 RepID=UPI001E4861AB|nr:hypothetical protein [Sulfurimonas sp. HSL-3221]UFS63402.1 hypothetical protein LOH54_04545 [Sulfurimonas sp. HSL-3221]